MTPEQLAALKEICLNHAKEAHSASFGDIIVHNPDKRSGIAHLTGYFKTSMIQDAYVEDGYFHFFGSDIDRWTSADVSGMTDINVILRLFYETNNDYYSDFIITMDGAVTEVCQKEMFEAGGYTGYLPTRLRASTCTLIPKD